MNSDVWRLTCFFQISCRHFTIIFHFLLCDVRLFREKRFHCTSFIHNHLFFVFLQHVLLVFLTFSHFHMFSFISHLMWYTILCSPPSRYGPYKSCHPKKMINFNVISLNCLHTLRFYCFCHVPTICTQIINNDFSGFSYFVEVNKFQFLLAKINATLFEPFL